MSELAEKIILRQASMQADRAIFDAHWQEIVDYLMPYRQGITSSGTPGEKKMSKILDSTATHAMNLLASGLHGMLTNPALPWFSLKLRDDKAMESDDVKAWLQDTEKRIYAALAQSNFGTEIHECYLDLVGLGTACMFIGEDMQRGLYFDNRHLAEMTIAENNRGEVDTVFRKFTMTARQMLQEWPKDCSPDVIEAARDKPDKTFEIIHAVYPREERNQKKKDRKNFPVASIYLEVARKNILSEGGFAEMAYVTPRWSMLSGEVFGRSQAMIALPDVKLLNEMAKTTLKAAQKKVDPPLMLSHDSFINPIRTTPGGINIIRADEVTGKIQSFPVPSDIGISLEMMDQLRMSIRNIFFNDLLQFAGDVTMTATEVMQRSEEKLRLMGPVLGRLQSEFLRPLIDRVFGILWRQKKLALPPEQLQGQDIDVEYISPLAKAQKGSEIKSISLLFEMAMPLVQTVPDVLDNINTDEVVRYVADIQGIPEKIVRSIDDVAELRAQRQQAVAAQQQMAIAQGMADAVPKLSGAVDESSPLAMLALGEAEVGMEEDEL